MEKAMRQPSVIGNWKLNVNKDIIKYLLTVLTDKFKTITNTRIIIAPPVMYLNIAKNYLLNSTIKLCAQNVDTNVSGAFTGDISASMLKDLETEYVLIGHSERRIHHKENDLYIAKKFSILKKTGLIPILCIGENKEEYDSGATQSVCIKQINTIIKLLGIKSFQNSIIAYEPIWAIGSGISASPKNVQLIHKSIRNYIAKYSKPIASTLLIQYGGSVTSNNIIEFISQDDIDGVLVGNASLNVNSFSTIVQLIDEYAKNNP